MKIRIYDVDQDTGKESLQGEAFLSECFEPDDPELDDVLEQLTKQGRAWIGGGASPLRLLMTVS